MFRAPSPTPSDMKESSSGNRNFNWLQLKCLIFEILHIAGTPPRALEGAPASEEAFQGTAFPDH